MKHVPVHLRFRLLAPLAVSALTTAGDMDCSGPSRPTDDPGMVPISVTLRNLDTTQEAVHIFDVTEDFPCCRLAPNETRLDTVLAARGDNVVFSAGRNGQRLTNVTCTVGANTVEDKTAEVHFTSAQTLICVGWS
jgi:hypothetical protein